MSFSKKIACLLILGTPLLGAQTLFAEPAGRYPLLNSLCKAARQEASRIASQNPDQIFFAQETLRIPLLNFSNEIVPSNTVALSLACTTYPFTEETLPGLELQVNANNISYPTEASQNPTIQGSFDVQKLTPIVDQQGISHPQYAVAAVFGEGTDQSLFVSRLIFNLDPTGQPEITKIAVDGRTVPVAYFSGLSNPDQFARKPTQKTGTFASGNYVKLAPYLRKIMCGSIDSSSGLTPAQKTQCENRWANYVSMVRSDQDSVRLYEFNYARHLGFFADDIPDYGNLLPKVRLDFFKVFDEIHAVSANYSFYDAKFFETLIKTGVTKISALNEKW